MDKEIMQELLKAIKSDDVSLFARIIENKKSCLSLCYGRLPVLSLCYLYKSKKINGAYGHDLLKINSYIYADEDYDAYKMFRSYARTSLRLYVLSKSVVTPLEMLAITGDTLLSEVYAKGYKDEKIIANINRILISLHGQEALFDNDRIIIKRRKKLSKIQRVSIVIIVFFACLMIAFSGVAWDSVYRVGGRGTAENPIKVSGENQLKEALNGDMYYSLTKDIYLTEDWIAKDFVGNINGRGHTIYVTNYMINGFINNLQGTIENIGFVLGEVQEQINKSKSFIVITNNGVMSNINLSITGDIIEDIAGEDIAGEDIAGEGIFVGLLCMENNGDIVNCVVDAKINFEGRGINDTHIAAVAAINNGNIYKCSVKEGSSIETDTVHIGGIASINGEEGVIDGCVNDASLTQNTSSENWFPQIGGIAWYNFGIVKNSINNGDIKVYSGAIDRAIEVYAGGVVCVNNNQIIKSKNNADIDAQSEHYHIYMGGIVAFNNTDYSDINNSASYGELIASSGGGEAYVFVGGIAGYSLGMIEDSFAYNNFVADKEKNLFLGGIAGLVLSDSASAINNYYVEHAAVLFGAAAILYYPMFGSPILEDGSDWGVVKVATYEALKAVEVYWQ